MGPEGLMANLVTTLGYNMSKKQLWKMLFTSPYAVTMGNSQSWPEKRWSPSINVILMALMHLYSAKVRFRQCTARSFSRIAKSFIGLLCNRLFWLEEFAVSNRAIYLTLGINLQDVKKF